ncbi:unnamed protein product, partial [Allacma fusca]
MPGKLLGNILENKSIVFGDGNPEIKRSISSALAKFGKAKAVYAFSADSSFFGRQSLLLMVPYMSKIMLSRIEYTKNMVLRLAQVMRKVIEEHESTRENLETRSITDIFLTQKEQEDLNCNTICDENPIRNSLHLVYTGLFMAAVDSTSTAL